MLRQQAAEALDLVLDAIGAQGMPIGGRVHGDDGLAKPQLGGRGKPYHRQVGANLHDGIDVVAVEPPQRVATLRRRDLGDRRPRPALECNVAHHAKPTSVK